MGATAGSGSAAGTPGMKTHEVYGTAGQLVASSGSSQFIVAGARGLTSH